MRRSGAVMAAALLLTACGGDDGESTTPITDPAAVTSTTEESSTTSTTEDPEAAVEQAYYDQWDAFVEILSNPDPANPLIEKHFTGEARELLLTIIANDIRDQVVTELPQRPEHFRPRVETVTVDGESALVTECVIDGLVVRQRESGEVVNDDLSTSRIENTFVLEDGRWKVARSVRLEKWEGVSGCAAGG